MYYKKEDGKIIVSSDPKTGYEQADYYSPSEVIRACAKHWKIKFNSARLRLRIGNHHYSNTESQYINLMHDANVAQPIINLPFMKRLVKQYGKEFANEIAHYIPLHEKFDWVVFSDIDVVRDILYILNSVYLTDDQMYVRSRIVRDAAKERRSREIILSLLLFGEYDTWSTTLIQHDLNLAIAMAKVGMSPRKARIGALMLEDRHWSVVVDPAELLPGFTDEELTEFLNQMTNNPIVAYDWLARRRGIDPNLSSTMLFSKMNNKALFIDWVIKHTDELSRVFKVKAFDEYEFEVPGYYMLRYVDDGILSDIETDFDSVKEVVASRIRKSIELHPLLGYHDLGIDIDGIRQVQDTVELIQQGLYSDLNLSAVNLPCAHRSMAIFYTDDAVIGYAKTTRGRWILRFIIPKDQSMDSDGFSEITGEVLEALRSVA